MEKYSALTQGYGKMKKVGIIIAAIVVSVVAFFIFKNRNKNTPIEEVLSI